MKNNNIDSINAGTEALKNFNSVVNSFLAPQGLDAYILEGHKKIIERIVNTESLSEETIAFLCGYKKLVKEYKNCKDAAERAKKYLKENSKSHDIDEDWLDFYFDKVRLVSDDKVRDIWSRILAEEANNPGYIKPSLLHTLSIMSKDQAAFFSNIARFCMREYKGDKVHPLIFLSTNIKSYARSNIDHKKLRELERLGLVDCEFMEEYVFIKKKEFVSGNHTITVFGDPNNDNKIKAGNVIFTEDGNTLYSVVSDNLIKYRKDIFEFILEKFKARNCRVLVNGKDV